MKSSQIIKQKVCLLFLAVGIGLATISEIGCFNQPTMTAEQKDTETALHIIING